MIWPPPSEPLQGSVVSLEPLAAGHRDGLREAARDPEIWTWIDRRVPEGEREFDRWFDERLAASESEAEWCFATVSVEAGEPVGSSSYLNPSAAHDRVEIGWTWLHPSTWGTGVNVEAKLLMISLAFEHLGCMRVEFKTDARNERSRGALAALPATFEGILHKHMLVPVVGVRDSAYFSIVDDDWPRVKAGLTARLEALRPGGS